MIKNFETIKQQLEELAPIINSFKSETVQLRVIELIFSGEGVEQSQSPKEPIQQEEQNVGGKAPKRKRKPKTRAQAKPNGEEPSSRAPSRGGSGAHSSVTSLVEEGFFATPRTIRSIIDHLGTNKGRHFKANHISPSLLRLLRENKLTRAKNAENQYEYQEA